LTQPETQVQKKARPLVPFLRIPDDYPDAQPYLWGSRCGNCGTAYLGSRLACAKCGSADPFTEIQLSDEGEIYVFTVVYQSVPGLESPYVAAIIDLPEGVSVRANVYGLDVDKPSPDWFGKKVKMYTEKVRVDREGNDIIAAKYRVVGS